MKSSLWIALLCEAGKNTKETGTPSANSGDFVRFLQGNLVHLCVGGLVYLHVGGPSVSICRGNPVHLHVGGPSVSTCRGAANDEKPLLIEGHKLGKEENVLVPLLVTT